LNLYPNDLLDIFPKINQEFVEGETVLKVRRHVVAGTSLMEDYEVTAPDKLKVFDIEVYPKDQSSVGDVIDQISEAYNDTNAILKQHGLPLLFDKNKIRANAGKWEDGGDKINYTKIIIKFIKYMEMGLGDKMSNRHAAKGVITRVIDDDKMPRNRSGESMDVIINPLSVISRMNLGQLAEAEVGRILYEASKKIAFMINKKEKRSVMEDFIIDIYEGLDPTSDKSYSSNIAKSLKSMNANEFDKYMTDIANRKIHFVVAPFRSPSSKQIAEVAKKIGTNIAEPLFIPEIDRWTSNPVVWGYQYIQKLEHIAEIKESSRNIGPYIKTTLEPTRGKARAGGQRMGELDTWCLLSYDAKNVLQDFWLVNADNPEVKKVVLSDIYENGKTDLDRVISDVSKSGSRTMFESIMIGMGLQS
jgi:DNA-directed RNA polymerase subunit beta